MLLAVGLAESARAVDHANCVFEIIRGRVSFDWGPDCDSDKGAIRVLSSCDYANGERTPLMSCNGRILRLAEMLIGLPDRR